MPLAHELSSQKKPLARSNPLPPPHPPPSSSILCVLSFSTRLLETRKTATQREIYYTYVKHFANQVIASHYVFFSKSQDLLQYVDLKGVCLGTSAKRSALVLQARVVKKLNRIWHIPHHPCPCTQATVAATRSSPHDNSWAACHRTLLSARKVACPMRRPHA